MIGKLVFLILLSFVVSEVSLADETPTVWIKGTRFGDTACYAQHELKGALRDAAVMTDYPVSQPLVVRYFIIGLNPTRDGDQAGTLLREAKVKLLPHETEHALNVKNAKAYRKFSILKIQIMPSESYRVAESYAVSDGPDDLRGLPDHGALNNGSRTCPATSGPH